MKNRCWNRISALLVVVALVSMITGCTLQPKEEISSVNNQAVESRVVTDMLNREVEVPTKVDKVLSTSPPSTMLIYMLAPEKLGGWNFKPNGRYIPDKYYSLPVVGGWFGRQGGNYEEFLALEPDIVVEGFTTGDNTVETIKERQQKLGQVPIVGIANTTNPQEWEELIQFTGDLLGRKEKAEELISFYQEAVNYIEDRVEDIPQDKRKRVYYAEKNGLFTEPQGSRHARLINLCGGVNVAQVPIKKGYGMAKVSIEKVINWNPEVIIVGRGSSQKTYQKILSDSKWQQLQAVQEERVYLRPTNPFSWLDGPPGVNQIIGIYWLAKRLYPNRFKELDLKSKIKEFYAKFYHYQLSEQEVNDLLTN
ncbi:MAG: ABC transporter substrate-binding protein [Bacillota bacterium]